MEAGPKYAVVTAMQVEHRAISSLMIKKLYEVKGYQVSLTRPEFGLYDVIERTHEQGRDEAFESTYQFLVDIDSIDTVFFVGTCGLNPRLNYDGLKPVGSRNP